MIRIRDISLPPEHDNNQLIFEAAKLLKISGSKIRELSIFRRSIDARKKPDVRYKKADDLFALPVIQSAILENAARYVKPGGVLLYSTCTILPEENQQITDAFLAEHPGFVRETMSLPLPVGKVEGQMTFWPQRHETDGFYICRMKRQA